MNRSCDPQRYFHLSIVDCEAVCHTDGTHFCNGSEDEQPKNMFFFYSTSSKWHKFFFLRLFGKEDVSSHNIKNASESELYGSTLYAPTENGNIYLYLVHNAKMLELLCIFAGGTTSLADIKQPNTFFNGIMDEFETSPELYEIVKNAAPILWQHGALARLQKGETIDPLLYGGYSTISLGYAGLCECTRYMMGTSHTNPEAKIFALSVLRYMNMACDRWTKETDIAFSIYGSPIESTTYKFAKCLQKRFGIIEGVTDKGYITNNLPTQNMHAMSRKRLDFCNVVNLVMKAIQYPASLTQNAGYLYYPQTTFQPI